MFKKVLAMLSLVVVCLSVAGCGKTIQNYVEENMSEITNEYYQAENDNIYATLSVGTREKDYLYNGQSTESVNFMLLTLTFKNDMRDKVIHVQVKSGENTVSVEAELNNLSDAYMVDLVDTIVLGDMVEIVYENETLPLTKVSNDFQIDAQKAITIACENLSEKLEACKSYNNFNAECYLRVLNQKQNNFNELYWCFTCLNYEGESFSIIISTVDGEILAQTE